jgi:protocatechuate 3,4-dioxygenase beta subunit
MVIALLVALSLNQAPAPEQAGQISGRVTLAGTGSPVSGARVALLPAGRQTGPMGPPPQAMTDQDGQFAFDRIVPGAYRLDVQKAGLAPPDDASRNRTITVPAGQLINVSLQMQKGAVITGKVFDPAGEPLTDARVMVLRRMPMPAGGARGLPPMPRLVPVPTPGAQTNDLGEFRVSGLAPGEYFVVVSPRSIAMFGTAASSPVRDRKVARSTLPTTYYPGTTDQAGAEPITVAAGAEVGSIFLTMRPVPAFRVSGVVVDEDGKPVGDSMVMLMSDPRSGGMMGPVGSSMSKPNGEFEIDDVPAGTYRLNASIVMRPAASGGGAVAGGVVAGASSGIAFGNSMSWSTSSSDAAAAQPAEIVVADADVTGARVVVRRPNPR